MAISNTKLLQTNKPLSLPLLAFITMTFLMLLNRVNSADSLSFTFDKFDPDQEDLILQGDATTDPITKVLHLTNTDNNGIPEDSSVGRALFLAPVRLWEKFAVVASFDTTFKFVISSTTSKTSSNARDNTLTFFIAPPNTTIPDPGNFVLVEFHPYPHVEYPRYPHIGIEVSSPRLSAYSWWEWQDGETATAHISYNSASSRLSVITTYPNGETVVLYYDIDLKTVLPEWVRVGFSGNSTGEVKHTNDIRYWSFRSSLESNYKV